MRDTKPTILVTGSNGYIGYAVAQRLAESFNVVGFDRQAPSHPPPTAECLYVDITFEPSLRRGLETVRNLHGDRLASVVHLAAHYDFTGAPSPLYEKVTVRGSERLLRLLREYFTVEQFIFSSTMLRADIHSQREYRHTASPIVLCRSARMTFLATRMEWESRGPQARSRQCRML